jgi:hypothetical protein
MAPQEGLSSESNYGENAIVKFAGSNSKNPRNSVKLVYVGARLRLGSSEILEF